MFVHAYAYVPVLGFAATLLCEDSAPYGPAVSGGACGTPEHSQQTHKAKEVQKHRHMSSRRNT